MKTAVISDIHGNLSALEAVLDDIASHKCDRIICLGDVVGYGYAPNECIELVSKKCWKHIMGNHDCAAAGHLSLSWFNSVAASGIRRDRAKISENNLRWLQELPFQWQEENAVYTHGSIDGDIEFPYINGITDAYFTMEIMEKKDVKKLFVGHTHYAIGYQKAKDARIPREHLEISKPITVSEHLETIVNVGSVGYPRNQPLSVYAIYDDTLNRVSWHFLPFDFKAYCRELKRADIPPPNWMWRWVEKGLLTADELKGR